LTLNQISKVIKFAKQVSCKTNELIMLSMLALHMIVLESNANYGILVNFSFQKSNNTEIIYSVSEIVES